LIGDYNFELGDLGPGASAERVVTDFLTFFKAATGDVSQQDELSQSPLDLSEAFLGSAQVKVIPVANINSTTVRVKFIVTNTTSLGSLVHLPGYSSNTPWGAEQRAIASDATAFADAIGGPLKSTSQQVTFYQDIKK
jgi:hypothetical protein